MTITPGFVSSGKRDEGKRVKDISSAREYAHLERIPDYTTVHLICYRLFCRKVVYRGTVCTPDSMALPDPGDRHALIQGSRCIDPQVFHRQGILP
jgi:hypothetical protein